MPVSKIRGHFRIDAKGNTTSKNIGQISYATRSKTGVMHLGVLPVRGEGPGLTPEGGRRRTTQTQGMASSVAWHLARRQAWQADGETTSIRPSSSHASEG